MMTWKQFKDIVESQGVVDTDKIHFIDIASPHTNRTFVVVRQGPGTFKGIDDYTDDLNSEQRKRFSISNRKSK